MAAFITDIEAFITQLVTDVGTVMGAALVLFGLFWGGKKIISAVKGIGKG